MNAQAEIHQIKERIESVIENLDDVIFTLLREASRNSGERPTADKTLVQSRRALEKAARLLGTADLEPM
jgi:hypothetical protein